MQAASLGLLPDIRDTPAQGTFLNAATAQEPVVVLGAVAAQRLGIDRVFSGERIWLDSQWFHVMGILNQAEYAPEIDTSVLVGFLAAEKYLGFDGHPSTIYVRTQIDQVASVQALLAKAANPENPSQVNVSQPSQALTARAATQSALNGLFLCLGAVALLVGAIGVANIMVISVLKRRSEIGLRRALGATRGGHIRAQFLAEAVLLALVGGATGVGAVAVYTYLKSETTVIPAEAWAGGLAAAIVIGAIAGLLPALRAARMSPTQALWSLWPTASCSHRPSPTSRSAASTPSRGRPAEHVDWLRRGEPHRQQDTPIPGADRGPHGYADDSSRVLQDLHDRRGHLRDPAHDHRPGRDRAGCSVALTCGFTKAPGRERARSASSRRGDHLKSVRSSAIPCVPFMGSPAEMPVAT